MHEAASLVGIIVGAISGVIVAYLKANNKETVEVNKLKTKISDLEHRLDTLKTGFQLVFDQYERDFAEQPEKMAMLRDLRKVFEQWT